MTSRHFRLQKSRHRRRQTDLRADSGPYGGFFLDDPQSKASDEAENDDIDESV